MQNLNVTLVQADIAWEDRDANLAKYDQLLENIGNTDLVVLPEMFNTGFTMNPKNLWEDMEGPSVKWLQDKAAQLDAVVMASLIIQEEARYYNRLLWVNPDKSYSTYDKRHLFTMTEEPKHFTPGSQRLITEHQGWKFMPVVCFDLRFPVWLRNKEHYDCLIVNANWPEKRSPHWQTLLKARAIENQCYVIGVNRVGKDGNNVNFSGDSMAVNPMGDALIHMKHTKQVVQIDLPYESITKTRRHMPFLDAMDGFEVN